MYRLELHDVSKQYPAVKANDRVNLRVRPGEIHALLGENGAGKSTMMKIIYGAVRPDEGSISWNGVQVSIASPSQARELGISMVYQHFSLFDSLTAAQNIWLGLDRSISLEEVVRRVEEISRDYGIEVDCDRPVHRLSVGERQRVEIVRALLTDPKLLILDEPTSVLTPQAVEALFTTLRKLSSQGCSILYISHKLDEIRALCNQCTVLRSGRVTGEVDPTKESNASLSKLMIGAEPPALRHALRNPGRTVLSVKQLNVAKEDSFGTTLQDIDLDVRSGEIIGVAGVSGNGQQELLALLSGEDRRANEGSIFLDGVDVSRMPPRGRQDRGLRFVPEERLGRGAVPSMSLALNTLLTRAGAVQRGGWIQNGRVELLTDAVIRRFGVKCGGNQAPAKSLSGGNLQKFIVGREVSAQPSMLIVAQPTWGVDVGAAAQIRGELLKLRDEGCAVLVISEELEELFELADRLVVIAKGRVSPSLATSEATVETVGAWMSGLWTVHCDKNLETQHAEA